MSAKSHKAPSKLRTIESEIRWARRPRGTRADDGGRRRDHPGTGRRLTYEQFRYGFANAVSEDEAKELYDTYSVPGSGEPIFQAASANLNPWTEVKVKTKNPDRGPLLIISGENDHTVPPAIAKASYKLQKRNSGVTEMISSRSVLRGCGFA